MSNTVAALGLSVDSSQAATGAKNLDALSASAAKAEAAAAKLGKMGGRAIKEAGVAAGFSKREMADFERSMAGAARQMGAVEVASSKVHANATRFAVGLKGVNDNAKLTSHQMLNLSRQGNDVITMFAMGASPMMIFTSQIGQIYGALEEGPGGLKGSLKAIGTELGLLAARWGPMALGVGAVAGATYLVWKAASGPEAKSAEDALKGYSDLVESLETGYKAAADAATDFYAQVSQEGRSVALAGIQGTASELRASLAREIEVLFARTQGFITKWDDLSPAVLAGQQSIRDLGNQLKAGDLTAAQFREQIAKIRIDPETPTIVVEIADKLLDASVNAKSLEAALGAVGQAASVAGEKFGRLSVPSRQDMGPFERMNPEGFQSIVDGLNAQAAAMTKVSDDATKDYVRAAKEREAAIYDELATIVKAQERMLDLSDRLSADRAGLFMPDSEARIASQLKPYGLGLDSVEAGYIRQTEKLKEYRDLNREVWTGIGSDIIQNGVKPMDAIGNAFDRLNAKLLDQIFTGAADSIFGAIFGGQNTISAPTQANVGLSEANAMWVRMAGAPVGIVERGGALASVETIAANTNDKVSALNASTSDLAAYIRRAATARGIDPDIALRVARSEGLGDGIWQSNYKRNGYREPSYGPFQLLKGGKGTGFSTGMGNQFMAQTGLDPADRRNVYSGIDFALNSAAKNGWGAWYGAAKNGIGSRDGLSGARAMPIGRSSDVLAESATKLSTSATSFTKDFGQITGAVNAGIGQIADRFVPGFGGVLQQLLDGMSQKSGGGGIGGLLSGLLGGGTVSAGATRAIMAGAGGLFAHGGVSDRPAIFGEAGPEAAVPLPDGRSIPVTMKVPGYARMQSAANSQAPVISQTFINAPPVKEQREESDGRGGRRQTVVFDEAIAGTVGRPGSRSSRAVGSEFGLKKRIIR